MAYDLGDPVILRLEVKVDGVAVTPDTATLTVTGPTGTVTTVTPAATATGVYEHMLTPEAAGAYAYRWVTTGDGAGAESGGFTVGTPLVTLAEVKRHLGIPESYTADDVELLLHIDAATALVEDYVGPVLSRSVTVTAGYGTTILSGRVASVTSVLAGGVAVDYTVNQAAGLIDAPYGSVVTYVTGFDPIPAAIRLGALEVIKAGWASQRGALPLPAGGASPDEAFSFEPRQSDDLPATATRWLRPYRWHVGVA